MPTPRLCVVEMVAEVVAVVVKVVNSVVVTVGHSYSGHGHPSGHFGWHGHFSKNSSYSLAQNEKHSKSAGGHENKHWL